MRAINTIPSDEYAKRLCEAMRRMSKKISRLANEEDSLSMTADNKGDEEKALRHVFNSRALFWASQAIVITPRELAVRLEEISRREFVPTVTKDKSSVAKDIIYCERCGLEYRLPLEPEVIPFERIDGKLYCPNCIEYNNKE